MQRAKSGSPQPALTLRLPRDCQTSLKLSPSLSITLSVRLQASVRSCYTVFFHVDQTPIKLLAVPASPTIPSSRSRYPRAAVGMVKSQTSERSCRFVVARSLRSSLLCASRPSLLTYLATFLLSTTPSPSLLSMICSLCLSFHNV